MVTPPPSIADQSLPAIHRTLGGQIRELDMQAGIMAIDYYGTEVFLNPAGNIQGGILGAMLDDVTAMLVKAVLADGEHAPTLDLHLSFVRAAVPGRIEARASFVRRGRSVHQVRGELQQNGKLIATASATCMVI